MKNKKLLIGLLVMVLLTPIGIYLPDFFKAGDAWGEWSVESVKEKLGFAPAGMEKDAAIYKAPMTDYTLCEENSSLARKSVYYILSGVVGVAIISLFSFGLTKLIKRE